MADAVALLVAIYVFHRGSETPFFAGKVPGVTRDFDAFRDVVVDKVAAGSYFRQYDRTQLGSGKLFVVEKRPEDEPVCPTGRGINGETTDQVELPPGHCIILDIRGSLPAAAAPAAGGAAAGGAAGPPDYKLFARSLLAELKAEEEADKASVATPKEYEETGRQYIVSLLESNFGLRIVPNASLHRLDKEITAVLKGAVFDSEWDFRAPVLCSGPGPQTPGKTDDFVIYPDREAYIRPARPARGKVLTPTKIGAAEAPPPCDFIAIFEITTEADWTGNLLPRLEQRLAVSLDRARSLDASVSGILDVVAVIGVLGIAPWQRRMTSRVTAAKTPLLFEMMQASRFVFLYRDYAGSPHRSIAGRSGGKGGAGTGPQGPRGPLSPLAAAGGGGGTE